MLMFGFAINIALLESGVKILDILPYCFLWKRHIRLGLLETRTPRPGEKSTICIYFDYYDSQDSHFH